MTQARTTLLRHAALLACVLALAGASMNAQGRATAAPLSLVRQVQTALAHGDSTAARALAENAPANAAGRELALAQVEIFEGKDAQAGARLLPLASAAPMGDAAVELGLLEQRTGHRDQGFQRLQPIAAVRTFQTPDDYVRMARAARGIREFLLANDAYQRTANEPRADIQTGWGDLFLQRHRPADAITSYEDALKADPKWLPAMIGIARAVPGLADGEPKQIADALDAITKQAPEYPDLWLVRAEAALESDHPVEAKAALDHLAGLKPGTVDEAALRAALAYKDGGVDAADAAAARIHAMDPQSAAGYNAASEQATHDYRFDDAAALAGKGTAVDADDPVAHYDLGLALFRSGDEKAARVALERSWKLDTSALMTKNLLEVLDRIDTFVVVPHNEFIFKFAPAEVNVLKPYALPLADEAYRQYKERYGLTPKGPILVEVFDRHDDFAVRTVGLDGLEGALGSCFGRVVSMDSPKARPPGDFSWQATLWHEMAHVFTLQLSNYRVPRWLTEGISGYEEYRRNPAWGRELTLEFGQALNKKETFGIKKIASAFKSPGHLSMGYFEASVIVEHLVTTKGDAGLRTLLLAYAHGAKTDNDAFEQAYGQGIDQVEASYEQFVQQRYAKLAGAMGDPGKDVEDDDVPGLRALAAAEPGNFTTQVTFGRALVRAGDQANAREPLERAAALAPQAMGEGSPHGLLARIAENAGDTARARREWRALLLYDHTDIDAARRLAALATKDNATDDENYALRLIADLDPFDADTHVTLGRRLLPTNPTAALIEFQANTALGPKNPAEAHSDVADALIRLGRKDEAKTEAMLALKEAPTYARAQDLLLEAMAPGNDSTGRR